MPSFDKINYAIRTNKNIERKLIFESIKSLDRKFDIPSYQYIGMGSMWFVDFIMAHKTLRIEDMISIEKEEFAPRADFNKPYNCIKVWGGDTSKLLPNINYKLRSIFWLDYDTGLEGPALNDIQYIVERASIGSILLVTLNAHYRRLPEKDPDDNPMDRVEALRYLAGDLVKPGLNKKHLNQKNYPATLGKLLIDHVERCIKQSARTGQFAQLFHYHYSDNAPMVTVGGMIVEQDSLAKLCSCDIVTKLSHVTGEDIFKIDVPALTQKEIINLDQLLPTSLPITEEVLEDKFGFTLRQSQLSAYETFYKMYPIFGEIQF